jgi:hypothetical protein
MMEHLPKIERVSTFINEELPRKQLGNAVLVAWKACNNALDAIAKMHKMPHLVLAEETARKSPDNVFPLRRNSVERTKQYAKYANSK